jgi:hypothetical protein
MTFKISFFSHNLDKDIVLKDCLFANEDTHYGDIARDIEKHCFFKDTNRIISLSYETLTEYLKLLQEVAQAIHVSKLGSRTCFFLAAAVSDFYIPLDKVGWSV